MVVFQTERAKPYGTVEGLEDFAFLGLPADVEFSRSCARSMRLLRRQEPTSLQAEAPPFRGFPAKRCRSVMILALTSDYPWIELLLVDGRFYHKRWK